MVKADWLFLLTDVDCLYTANPATHPEAVPIPEVHDITKLQVSIPTILPPPPRTLSPSTHSTPKPTFHRQLFPLMLESKICFHGSVMTGPLTC